MDSTGHYLAFAPLQGYTDAVYRRAHHECAGGISEYYTPFVRLERGGIRRKELRDLDPAANEGVPTVAQVIARDVDEFARLCDGVQALGWRRIDLNIGCPFPMQVRSGRGSGLLQHPGRLEAIGDEMAKRPEVLFSVKMRLGQERAGEGLDALEVVNAMPLCHVTLHPRLGCQQYKGVPDLDAFVRFYERCLHPVVYNGDITALVDGEWQLGDGRRPLALLRGEGRLKGVMIGRGLLARPWMCSDRNPAEVLRGMHSRVMRDATERLCGDTQVLGRLHAFWEYLDIDRKGRKAIMKATTLSRYREAVAPLLR